MREVARTEKQVNGQRRGAEEPPVPDFHGSGFDAVQVRVALIGHFRLFVRLEVWQ